MGATLPRISAVLFLAWFTEAEQRRRRKQPRASIDLDVFTPAGKRACWIGRKA